MRNFVWRLAIVTLSVFLSPLCANAQTAREFIVSIEYAKPAFNGQDKSSTVSRGQRRYAANANEVAEIAQLQAAFVTALDAKIQSQVPVGRRSGLHKNVRLLSHLPTALVRLNDEEAALLPGVPGVRSHMEN